MLRGSSYFSKKSPVMFRLSSCWKMVDQDERLLCSGSQPRGKMSKREKISKREKNYQHLSRKSQKLKFSIEKMQRKWMEKVENCGDKTMRSLLESVPQLNSNERQRESHLDRQPVQKVRRTPLQSLFFESVEMASQTESLNPSSSLRFECSTKPMPCLLSKWHPLHRHSSGFSFELRCSLLTSRLFALFL